MSFQSLSQSIRHHSPLLNSREKATTSSKEARAVIMSDVTGKQSRFPQLPSPPLGWHSHHMLAEGKVIS